MNSARKHYWVDILLILLGAGIGAGILSGSQHCISLLLPALIALAGLLDLSRGLWCERDELKQDPMGATLSIYSSAWRKLWRNKWVPYLFVGVAVINLLGYLPESVIRIIAIHRYPEIWGPSTPHLWERLPGAMNSINRSLLSGFSPDLGLITRALGSVLFSALFFLTIPWLFRRLSSLAKETDMIEEVRFIRRLMIPLVLVLIAGAYALLRFVCINAHWMLTNSQINPPTAGILKQIGYMLYGVICSATANGFLMGGLLGSLLRLSEGVPVTLHVYVRESVRNFRKIFGVFLLFGLIGNIPFLFETLVIRGYSSILSNRPPITQIVSALVDPWLTRYVLLLLFLAPIAIVLSGTGIRKALGRSLKSWAQSPSAMIYFIGVGSLLLVLPLGAGQLLLEMTGRTSWYSIPASAVYLIIRAFTGAFIVVALFDLYKSLHVEQEEVSSKTA